MCILNSDNFIIHACTTNFWGIELRHISLFFSLIFESMHPWRESWTGPLDDSLHNLLRVPFRHHCIVVTSLHSKLLKLPCIYYYHYFNPEPGNIKCHIAWLYQYSGKRISLDMHMMTDEELTTCKWGTTQVKDLGSDRHREICGEGHR